jgi:hypothetical protein|tara:strand:+ start:219 stop:395 length:177 start_codon:yes stop_codon:yes gene_type:complete
MMFLLALLKFGVRNVDKSHYFSLTWHPYNAVRWEILPRRRRAEKKQKTLSDPTLAIEA